MGGMEEVSERASERVTRDSGRGGGRTLNLRTNGAMGELWGMAMAMASSGRAQWEGERGRLGGGRKRSRARVDRVGERREARATSAR